MRSRSEHADPLSVAIGRYPHTAPLLDGAVRPDWLDLRFAAVAPISRAFAPMVREGRFDVSEMAIATFLMAKAAGRPLVLLPVALMARFQEGALLCRADGPIRGPEDLAGRRIGVRAYSQTTGMWLRGILADARSVCGPRRCAGSPSRRRMCRAFAIRPSANAPQPGRIWPPC